MNIPLETSLKFDSEARAFAFAVISQVSKSSEDDVDVEKTYELFRTAKNYYYSKRCEDYSQD